MYCVAIFRIEATISEAFTPILLALPSSRLPTKSRELRCSYITPSIPCIYHPSHPIPGGLLPCLARLYRNRNPLSLSRSNIFLSPSSFIVLDYFVVVTARRVAKSQKRQDIVIFFTNSPRGTKLSPFFPDPVHSQTRIKEYKIRRL